MRLLIDGNTLQIDNVMELITQNGTIDLTPSAWERVKRCRHHVQEMVADSQSIVYGVNTGFGNFADKVINRQQLSKLQLNLIRSHAVGVGDPIPLLNVRIMFVLRINTLAKGRSGIRQETLKKLILAFNRRFIPMIPSQGTVGASGDLAPLAHLVLGLLGQGLAWNEQKGTYTASAAILAHLDLEPIKLRQKQGLALINGTQFMASILLPVVCGSRNLVDSGFKLACLSAQIFGMNPLLFSKEYISLFANQPSLQKVLNRASSYLGAPEFSIIHQNRFKEAGPINGNCKSVIDCWQNIAAVQSTVRICEKLLSQEINAATDNPLVYGVEDGFPKTTLISAGNFHGQYVSKCADLLCSALFSLGRFCQARIQRYVNGRTSKLPEFLVAQGGLNSGFMIAQYVSASLLSESKFLTNPSSVDSISTSSCQEDHVSMGGYATRKAASVYQNISYIMGIELMMAAQARQLIESSLIRQPNYSQDTNVANSPPQGNTPKRAQTETSKLVMNLRNKVSFMTNDRYYKQDIEQCMQFVRGGI